MAIARGRVVVEGPTSRRWSRETGYLTERFFQGPPRSLEALAASLQNSASEWILRSRGGTGDLTVVYADSQAGTENPTALWELDVNESQPSVYDSAAFQSLSFNDQAVIKRAVANNGGQIPSNEVMDDPVATQQFAQLVEHADSYVDDSWVLRKTVIASYSTQVQIYLPQPGSTPPDSEFRISLIGIGQLWTPQQIAAVEATMHPGIYSALINIPEPTSRANYTFGLLKRRPKIIGRAANKLEISQEWIQAQWSTQLYSVYA